MIFSLKYIKVRICICLAICTMTVQMAVGGEHPVDSLPDVEVTLAGQNNSVFNILNQVSRQTGYFFIYDSQIIDSDRKVRIRRGRYPLDELLSNVLNNDLLQFRLLDKYIIIYLPRADKPDTLAISSDEEYTTRTFQVQGRILDGETGNSLPFASIFLKGRSVGVTSNQDGNFKIRINDFNDSDSLQISYVGYKSRVIPISLLIEGFHEIYLDVDVVSLQEVVVTWYNPYEILNRALNARNDLYPSQASHHTSFYREGAFKDDMILNYSEAVFRIFKTSYNSQADDQVMLLKSRNITNLDLEDTLMLKLKAGVRSALELDVMKTLPEFLQPEFFSSYKYTGAYIVAFESGSAFAIEFQEAEYVREPLYRGTIYIDRETFAVLRAEFEIHPSYLRKHERRFIPRRSPDHITRIQNMKYVVQYRKWEGKYYLKHARGDIDIRIRPRNRLFGKNYNVFFEMAVVNIDTLETGRFRRRETLNTRSVFMDQKFYYDADFWKDFNIILPEKNISDALQEINYRLENLTEE
ncbi:MAG: hypothetical protein EA393_03060 [Bacteroidetes bacterium]|nr:MAG: hypothetical protein EA393_03060 [Bacteroidota bacterium]